MIIGGILKGHSNHCISWILQDLLSFAPPFADISGKLSSFFFCIFAFSNITNWLLPSYLDSRLLCVLVLFAEVKRFKRIILYKRISRFGKKMMLPFSLYFVFLIFRRDPLSPRPFEGLKFVDVGCGGGIVSEVCYHVSPSSVAPFYFQS